MQQNFRSNLALQLNDVGRAWDVRLDVRHGASSRVRVGCFVLDGPWDMGRHLHAGASAT